jgi:3-phytase
MKFRRAWLLAMLALIAGCDLRSMDGPSGPGPGEQVVATLETPPVDSAGDAADDPAIWVHPVDPALSLVIATDKQSGLYVYDADGNLLQTLPDGRMINVDLRDGFLLGGASRTLVAASNRSDDTIALYLLDPATRRLTPAGERVPTGFTDPYGLCMYAAPGGEHYVFVNETDSGRFRQWLIQDGADGIAATMVREFSVGSQAEGCAADDELGQLYVAEENVALWRYSADPAGGAVREEIDRVGGTNGLAADLEGVAIWRGAGGNGFVVVSNQGANNYAVYRRGEDNDFIGQFAIVKNTALGIDGVTQTDGLDVTHSSVGPRFPDGLLVVQDGSNQSTIGRQNFKYIPWRAVAEVLGIWEGE